MLSREPISLTMCCCTKEERPGFGDRVILVDYIPVHCLEECHLDQSGLGLGEDLRVTRDTM